MSIVVQEQLERLASCVPTPSKLQPSQGWLTKGKTTAPPFDLGRWLADRALDVIGPRHWNGNQLWVFRVCPWNEAHTNRSAFVIQFPNGALCAGCHHNGCADKDWGALRDLVEPGWRDSPKRSRERSPRRKKETAPEPTTTDDPDAEHFTDLGNAKRLVGRHGSDLRFVRAWNSWLIWNGRYWRSDATGEIVERAKETVQVLYAEAMQLSGNDARKKDLLKHALRSEAEARIKAMIKLAESESAVALTPDQVDADPWALNCLNGTIDLRTGELRPHRREDLLTKLAPVEYDSEARFALWDHVIHHVTGGEPAFRAFLQRAFGYSATGDASEEKLFFIYGGSRTGKGTVMEAVKATLGDYAKTADFETFLARQASGSPRNDIARLAGAHLVVSAEVDDGKKLAEGLVKNLTGGDRVTARFLYREAFEFEPTFKLWLVANRKPKVPDDDDGMWNRILLLPFDNEIPKKQRDPKVKKVLRNPKLAGHAILAWIVQGCLAWQREGLGVPEVVEEATEDYRREMDPLKDFLAECCVLVPQAWTKKSKIRSAYEAWCRERGERHPLSPDAFADRLRGRGIEDDRRHAGRGWRGIGFRTEAAEERDRAGEEKVTWTSP